MHITIFALGSQGDVRPYIALAAGLRGAGYRVRMATHEEFLPLIEGRDIEFAPVGGNPRELLEDERAHRMLAAGENVLKFLGHFNKLLEPFFMEMTRDCVRATAGTDAVVLSSIGIIAGFHQIAEAMRIPYCVGLLQPVTPTRAFPSTFVPEYPRWLPVGRGAYNHWSHRAFAGLFWHFFKDVMPLVRRELGLPPMPLREIARQAKLAQTPILYGYSPSVISPPPDWPPHLHVTGYWFLDGPVDWQPSAALLDFLAAGPPPVYVGFGSMRNRDPEATTRLVVEALRTAKQRGILLTGWGGLRPGDLGDDMLPIDSTSHEWLLPRCAAVVHHGGAGTTAAGLRSGVPSIVVPFFADQPFWARTVHALGAGPRPIPRKALTAPRLADAVTQAITDTTMHSRAAAIGERIRAEDGVTRAVEIISEHFNGTEAGIVQLPKKQQQP
ncbi:MAG: glycosyltransferase [Armatimonadota bacterium]